MPSLATLVKRAKGGDVDALAAIVAQTEDTDDAAARPATEALGRVATKQAYEALAKIALDHPHEGLRFTAMQKLDRALKKSPDAIELVIRMCEDPRVDTEGYPITLLANLACGDKHHAKDPRVLKSLRRAIHATHVYAQEAAIGTLVKLGDKESLPHIVARLDQQQRGPELLRCVAEAILKLGGSAADLAKLREAAKTRTSRESIVDDVIEKIEKKLEL